MDERLEITTKELLAAVEKKLLEGSITPCDPVLKKVSSPGRAVANMAFDFLYRTPTIDNSGYSFR